MRNITIEAYAQLKDTTEYDTILKHLHPHNYFADKIANIGELPYTTVAHSFGLIQSMDSWYKMVELFTLCYGIDEKTFWNEKIRVYYAAINFLKAEFERLAKAEEKLLHSTNTDSELWERAGGARLKPFGKTSPLDDLACRYGQYPFDLGKKPYNEIIYLLSLVKVKNEVSNEYQKLKVKK
jgi:hypothetical protein